MYSPLSSRCLTVSSPPESFRLPFYSHIHFLSASFPLPPASQPLICFLFLIFGHFKSVESMDLYTESSLGSGLFHRSSFLGDKCPRDIWSVVFVWLKQQLLIFTSNVYVFYFTVSSPVIGIDILLVIIFVLIFASFYVSLCKHSNIFLPYQNPLCSYDSDSHVIMVKCCYKNQFLDFLVFL